jgi:ubiquinone/menaquinone biosynthesis C-methylase UbiE
MLHLRNALGFVAFGLIALAVAWRFTIYAIHSLVLKRLFLIRGMRVADIGCGRGRLTARIAKRVGPTGDVIGMDVDPRALRAAEARANAGGLANARFILAGAGEGRLDRSRLDRVALVAVLGEITQRDAAMAEIFRALKPGGMLSVTEVALDPHRRSDGEVRRLADAAGFVERAWFGNRLLFTINLVKPPQVAPQDGAPSPNR